MKTRRLLKKVVICGIATFALASDTLPFIAYTHREHAGVAYADPLVFEDGCDDLTGTFKGPGELKEGGEGPWTQEGTGAYYRAKYTFEVLVSFGLSNTAAAGVFGNIAVESGGSFHPAVIEAAYASQYTIQKVFPDITWAPLTPTPKADTAPNDGNFGTGGYGLFQETPGSIIARQDGVNGWKFVEPFGTLENSGGWEKKVYDVNAVSAAIYNVVEYMFLVKSGAGGSGSGYAGVKAQLLNNATSAGYSSDPLKTPKDIEEATRYWYWWYENGIMDIFYGAQVGGDQRVKYAQQAYDMFKVAGREHYDANLLQKVGEDGNKITSSHTDSRCKPKKKRNDNVVEIAMSLVGFWHYSQLNRASVIPTLDNPQKGVGETDCSGFVWSVYKMAGYRVPEQMGTTCTMYADAYGPQEYYELVPESEAKAGDAIVHDPGGTCAFPAHTGILQEDWHGPDTPIVQEGGVESNVNAGNPASASIASPYFFVRPKSKE